MKEYVVLTFQDLDIFIFKHKYFSLENLKNHVQYINYGHVKIINKPPLISEEPLKKLNLQMSANEMLCFTNYW